MRVITIVSAACYIIIRIQKDIDIIQVHRYADTNMHLLMEVKHRTDVGSLEPQGMGGLDRGGGVGVRTFFRSPVGSKYLNKEYFAQTMLKICYVKAQNPHHVETWTRRDGEGVKIFDNFLCVRISCVGARLTQKSWATSREATGGRQGERGCMKLKMG